MVLKASDFVAARLYDDEEAVIQDALATLLETRPELRIRLAVHRYQTEPITVAKAAELAGVTWPRTVDLLREHGVQPEIGPATIEEALDEARSPVVPCSLLPPLSVPSAPLRVSVFRTPVPSAGLSGSCGGGTMRLAPASPPE